jgi:dihydroxyacid dehydratase/phosphogluconate dehydratase
VGSWPSSPDVAYLALVEVLHGYPFDAVVLTTGCDKTTPACLMAAATVALPAIVLSGGPKGIPSSTTSAGWLGYTDEKLCRVCQEAVDAGWSHVKLKVGADIDEDVRRCASPGRSSGPSAS